MCRLRVLRFSGSVGRYRDFRIVIPQTDHGFGRVTSFTDVKATITVAPSDFRRLRTYKGTINEQIVFGYLAKISESQNSPYCLVKRGLSQELAITAGRGRERGEDGIKQVKKALSSARLLFKR